MNPLTTGDSWTAVSGQVVEGTGRIGWRGALLHLAKGMAIEAAAHLTRVALGNGLATVVVAAVHEAHICRKKLVSINKI